MSVSEMNKQSLYKAELMHHYRHPRNKCEGEISGASSVQRGSNPRCGDEIEIGLFTGLNRRIDKVKFRGRGCSVCIASASMMTEAVSGLSAGDARSLCQAMTQWFQSGDGAEISDPPEVLEALDAVREFPARRRCVLLSWEALHGALEKI
jgi:nitrogen fixation NifU-like protein